MKPYPEDVLFMMQEVDKSETNLQKKKKNQKSVTGPAPGTQNSMVDLICEPQSLVTVSLSHNFVLGNN